MNTILIIVAIIFIAVIVLFSTKKKDIPTIENLIEGERGYEQLGYLLTPAERSFFCALKIATKDEYEVFSKVRVADILTPTKNNERRGWQTAFNKISSKHFDFIVCSKDDLSPLCAIELNDKSHQSKKTMKRDEFLMNACKSAQFTLHMIKAKDKYSIQEIKNIINPLPLQ